MSEPVPEKVEHVAPQETEDQSKSKPSRGGFSARGGRGRGQVKYVQKREDGQNVEEFEENKEKSSPKKKYKEGRKPLEKETITLDTPVPEKPKKHDILKEPNDDEYNKKYTEITDKIDDLHKKFHKYVEEIRETKNSAINKNNSSKTPLKDLFVTKLAEKKRVNEEFKFVRDQVEKLKAEIDFNYEEGQKLRKKLSLFTKADIESELKRLIDLQEKGNISLPEEKKTIKQIAELRRSLTFVGPLEIYQRKVDDAKIEKKKLTEKSNLLFTQLKKLNEEIDELKQDMDKMQNETKATKESINPLIESKKEELNLKTEELYAERKKITDKHNKDWDNYEAQQKLLKRIEWLTKIKNRLRREEEYRKEEEELKKQEAEEKQEQAKVIPHEEDINLCDLLISYTKNLLPKNVAVQNEEKKVDNTASMQEQWQKEKVTVIQSKRDQDNDFFVGKGKKNQKKGEKKKIEEVHALNHQVEVISFFERLKVPTPLFANKLEETLKLLNEKRNYFVNAPAEEKKDEKIEIKEEEKHHNAFEKKKKDFAEVTEQEFPSF